MTGLSATAGSLVPRPQLAARMRAVPGAAGPALSPLDVARALLGELGDERSEPRRRVLAGCD